MDRYIIENIAKCHRYAYIITGYKVMTAMPVILEYLSIRYLLTGQCGHQFAGALFSPGGGDFALVLSVNGTSEGWSSKGFTIVPVNNIDPVS